MEYSQDKVDDMVLALLFLTSSTNEYGTRAWKGLDVKVLDRLYHKGYISDPREKGPTMQLSEQGAARSRELFAAYFGVEKGSGT
jgi:hypothetical protein